MRVMTTAIQFDNAGNVVYIDRGMSCPKIDSQILTACRVNWLTQGVHQNSATGQFVVSYGDRNNVSIQRQFRGAYVNNQQFFDFEEIDHGVIHC